MASQSVQLEDTRSVFAYSPDPGDALSCRDRILPLRLWFGERVALLEERNMLRMSQVLVVAPRAHRPSFKVGVSRQILSKEALLVKEPLNQERHHRRDRHKPPVRAERQWRADKVQARARVHRVAYDRVGPGADYFLILGKFDGR